MILLHRTVPVYLVILEHRFSSRWSALLEVQLKVKLTLGSLKMFGDLKLATVAMLSFCWKPELGHLARSEDSLASDRR